MTISEERRLVTVLFVDMVGFTGRTESSDPEVVREIQRTYFETVAAEPIQAAIASLMYFFCVSRLKSVLLESRHTRIVEA